MKFFNGSGRVVALLTVVLAGCSGGSDGNGGSDGGTSQVSENSTERSCPSGVSACSGDMVGNPVGTIRLTSNGLQAVAASTSDLAAGNTNTTEAFGLQPTTDGFAEIRVLRDSDANISAVDLLLSDLKLYWDGKTERPRIIENFGITRGRVQPGAQGMSTMTTLPVQGDPFWDNNPAAFTGTQDHYANNHYFERTAPACGEGDGACIAAANNGLALIRGDWKRGGIRPNQVNADRLHEDGATQAPDQIPYAGFKGYRSIWNWNFDYANVAGWITKDTVHIQEWGGGDEHNKERRGTLAFGQLTDAKLMPGNGTANYRGYARGWYSPDGASEVFPIAADILVIVNFAEKQATLQLLDVRIDESLPAAADPAVKLATTSTNSLPFGSPVNTAIGTITHGGADGHAGLRFYGPTSNGAPPEIAGSFTIKGNSGISAIGGFIGLRVTQ